MLIRADTGLHEQIAQTLAKKVERAASVLDMGAGQGVLSARLYDLGYKVTAVDVNDEDYLIQKRDIQFKQVNFDDEHELEQFIAGHESQFDVVCGVEVIEHVENPWNYVRGLAIGETRRPCFDYNTKYCILVVLIAFFEKWNISVFPRAKFFIRPH